MVDPNETFWDAAAAVDRRELNSADPRRMHATDRRGVSRAKRDSICSSLPLQSRHRLARAFGWKGRKI